MSWNLFIEKLLDGGIVGVHVAPTDGDGLLDAGHTIAAICECKPTMERSHFGDPVWTHRRFAEGLKPQRQEQRRKECSANCLTARNMGRS